MLLSLQLALCFVMAPMKEHVDLVFQGDIKSLVQILDPDFGL